MPRLVALWCAVSLVWRWFWYTSPPDSMNRPWPEWGDFYCVGLPIAIGMSIRCFVSGAKAWPRKDARGTCSKCSYDRAGLNPDAPCPECGANPARR